MSLYHAYRPQTFASIVGQGHITATLQAAVDRGAVAHAYLFSGPRGIGKTSIARILAMAVNCDARSTEAGETGKVKRDTKGKKQAQAPFTSHDSPFAKSEPCGECSSCQSIRSGSDLNVIEIDAASNRGIDEIRQLKEAIGFAPSGTLRKVYIIDEVHMLTKEAFNALLKTLEEPPAHALFILATTELHRVPDTIISRVQHFTFKRATIADTRSHLESIASQEGITLEPEATELVARHADGAFRDALSLLDQLAALGEKTITAEHIRLLLGVAPEAELLGALSAALGSDTTTLHASLDRFADQGYEPGALADALITTLRHLLWASYGLPSEGSESTQAFIASHSGTTSGQIVAFIERLITAKQQLRWSPLPMLPLQLALLPFQTIDDRRETLGNQPPIATAVTKTTTKVHQETVIQSVPDSSPPASGGSDVEEYGLVHDGTTSEVKEEHVAKEAKTKDSATKTKSAPNTSEGNVDTLTSQESVASQSAKNDDGGNSEVDVVSTEPITNLSETWSKILTRIRPKNAQLAALLKSSKLLTLIEGECMIEVPFSFYADRVKDNKNKTVIVEAIKLETGLECVVRCTVIGASTTEKSEVRSQKSGLPADQEGDQPARSSDDLAKDVIEVFGLEEVTSG